MSLRCPCRFSSTSTALLIDSFSSKRQRRCGTSPKVSVYSERSCTGHCSEKKIRPDRVFIRDELHWLPVVERIHFKQCMLIYKSLHDLAPAYSALYKTFRLRSALRREFVVPWHESRKQLLDVEVSSTLIHLYGMHSHMTFETLALHLTSFEMDLKLYYILRQ